MRFLGGLAIAIIGLTACEPVPTQDGAQAASDLIDRDAIYAANLEAAAVKVAAEKAERAARAACLADHDDNPAGLDAALSGSDEWTSHAAAMRQAAAQLVCNERCSLAELKDYGGWIASPNHGAGHYFTYCGGQDHVRYRVYLNVSTGVIGR